MEAAVFDLIRELKETNKDITWNDIADTINKRNGTKVTGDQVKKFVERGNIPFGGWLIRAIEDAFAIPCRHPTKYICFKDGGRDE